MSDRVDEKKYSVDWGIRAKRQRIFKTRGRAEAYQQALEARLREVNAVCDGKIWTGIDIIYETRWDCPTARLAAAQSQ